MLRGRLYRTLSNSDARVRCTMLWSLSAKSKGVLYVTWMFGPRACQPPPTPLQSAWQRLCAVLSTGNWRSCVWSLVGPGSFESHAERPALWFYLRTGGKHDTIDFSNSQSIRRSLKAWTKFCNQRWCFDNGCDLEHDRRKSLLVGMLILKQRIPAQSLSKYLSKRFTRIVVSKKKRFSIESSLKKISINFSRRISNSKKVTTKKNLSLEKNIPLEYHIRLKSDQ